MIIAFLHLLIGFWEFFGGGEEGVYLLEKLEAWYRSWVLFGFFLPFFFLGTNEKNSWQKERQRERETLTREGQRDPALKKFN